MMAELFKIILYALFAGITVFIGGLLSRIFEAHFQRDSLKKIEILHMLVAMGGGIIIAAVALVLVPKGMETLSLFPMILAFLGGSIIFFFLDRYIEKRGATMAQLLAMLMDFIPEAIALGSVFATDPNLGLLLAIFIGLQNLPESFNSYIDLRNSGYRAQSSLFILFLLIFPGIIASLSGYYWLSDSPQLTAALMLFASGGIIYLIFQDIAPMSKTNNRWFPTLGASFGFLIGMIGEKILG